MDTNRDRQKYSKYGESDYGINGGRGCLTLLAAIAIVAFLLSMMPQ